MRTVSEKRVGVRAPRPLAGLVALVLAFSGLLAPLGQAPAAHAAVTIVSVVSFGAKGDGVTDDSHAIQLAVRAGTAPRTVVFPAGTYAFRDVVVGSGTALVFDAGARAVALPAATSADVFFSVLGTSASKATNVSLTGGEFDGKSVMAAAFVTKYADGVTVDSVRSKGVLKNVGTDLSSNITVRSCSAEGSRWGFAFEQSQHIDVTGCSVKGTARDGIVFYSGCRYVTATGNRVEDYMTVDSDGVGGIQVYGSTDATVTGNTVLHGGYNSAGIRFRDSERFWCQGNYVDSPGSSGLQVSRVGDFPGLDGGNGTFAGNVVVRPHLFGIDVANKLSKPVRIVDNVVLDVTTKSTVSAATGIVAVPAGCVVVGNRVDVATGPGIHAGGGGSVVAWNRVHDVASVNFGPRVGVFVAGGASQVVVGNTIVDDTSRMLNGVRLYDDSSALIKGNAVTGATGAAYDIRGTQLSVLNADSVAPAVTSAVTGGDASFATVRFSATDARSRVVALRVTVDGSPARYFAGATAEVRVAGAGDHTVACSALDAAGNVSAYVTRSVSLGRDTKPSDAASVTALFAGRPAMAIHPPAGTGVDILAAVTGAGAPVHSAQPAQIQRLEGTSWVTEADTGAGTDGSLFYHVAPKTAVTYRVHYPGDAYLGPADGPALTIAPVTYQRIEGTDRVGTAISASKAAFRTGSADTVVISTSRNFPDALGGSSLAGAYGGPMLLTPPAALPSVVASEIVRVGAKRAVILGSTTAVSAEVERQLGALLGDGSVTRIGGANRYETAAAVATATVRVLRERGASFDGTVFVATGRNFPDALAASPIAAARHWPILLVSDSLPDATLDALRSVGATHAVVLGSTGAVPEAVAERLRDELGTGGVERLQGANRYRTAVEVARFGVRKGLAWNGLALATGERFPDALAGGVMQGRLGSVVLLTPAATLEASVGGVLSAEKARIAVVRYLGDTKAVSSAVRTSVTNVLW